MVKCWHNTQTIQLENKLLLVVYILLEHLSWLWAGKMAHPNLSEWSWMETCPAVSIFTPSDVTEMCMTAANQSPVWFASQQNSPVNEIRSHQQKADVRAMLSKTRQNNQPITPEGSIFSLFACFQWREFFFNIYKMLNYSIIIFVVNTNALKVAI